MAVKSWFDAPSVFTCRHCLPKGEISRAIVHCHNSTRLYFTSYWTRSTSILRTYFLSNGEGNMSNFPDLDVSNMQSCTYHPLEKLYHVAKDWDNFIN